MPLTVRRQHGPLQANACVHFQPWGDAALAYDDAGDLGGVTRRRRNVTWDPMEPAVPVENPAITHVLSTKTGQIHDAKELISSSRWGKHVQLRGKVLEAVHANRPRLLCPICRVPVYISHSSTKRAFFRHAREDGKCPSVTRSGLTQDDLRERIYQGRQESWRHAETKQFIAASLNADPDFSDMAVEKIVRSADGSQRRRPDVSATWRGELQVVFEAQLTTTFLDVVVRRRVFYQNQGALLVWVLSSFDPSDRRMTVDDLLFGNNSNVIVVDKATVAASQAAGQFMVQVHHRQVDVGSDRLNYTWNSCLVNFADLTLDQSEQQAFFYDFREAEKQARKEFGETTERLRLQVVQRSRENLIAKVLEFFVEGRCQPNAQVQWDILQSRLRSYGLSLPWSVSDLWQWESAVHDLASARAGRPVGHRFVKLVQVAHQTAQSRKWLIAAFLRVAEAFGRSEQLAAEDTSGRWRRRRPTIDAAIAVQHPDYRMKLEVGPLLCFLFPEME